MDELIKNIKQNFNKQFSLREKRRGIYQILIPIYHEDGDMIDLFVEEKDGEFYLSDFGLTIMRLSYSYEIDTPHKEQVFQKILKENKLEEDKGIIRFKTKTDTIFNDIMHVSQSLMKIGSMRFFKREVIESMFYENLEELINTELIDYNPKKSVFPIKEREDLEADYEFTPNGSPVYLFGVKDSFKARLATICCLEYQHSNLKFRSLIVHDDFEKLPQNDRLRITNASDKQFTSLEDFSNNARKYFEREKS